MPDRSSEPQHVFISYARADGREYADRLYRELTARGVSAWRDERDLDPYQDFTSEIELGLRQATRVVVCLTPSIVENPESFVRRETIYAQIRRKAIIPLVFPGGEPMVNIAHLTWIPFFKADAPDTLDFDSGMRALYARLGLDEIFLEPPRTAADPFKGYLEVLYDEIVDFLDSTVFSLIALHAESTPGAVDTPKEVRFNALPMTFRATSLSIKPTKSDEPPEEKSNRFDNFLGAFEHYGGRVLLLGEPGAGKTTTLMAFARDAVARRLEDPSRPLPLVARIADWPAEPPLPLIDWLTDKKGLDRAAVTREVEAGRALLLLDALDELGRARVIRDDKEGKEKERFDPRQRFLATLSDLPETNQTLVSSRVTDYQGIGEKIALHGAVTLQPLDDTQLAEYLRDQPDLSAAIMADSALREMVRTPLLLSLLTFAYQNQGKKARELRDLAHSSGELRDVIFRTYIERRYEHEKRKPHIGLLFSLDETYKLLGEVAVWSSHEGRWRQSSIWEILHQHIGTEVEAFVVQSQRLHLLIQSEKNVIRFAHFLLRDHFSLPYCLSNLKSSDPQMRRTVVTAMAEIKDDRVVEPLINALRSDSDPLVRRNAASALGKIKDARAIEPLLTALRSDDDAWVRREASEAVWGRQKASNHPSESAKVQTLDSITDFHGYSLGYLDNVSEPAINSFAAALQDPDNGVRQWAAWALVH